MTFLRKISRKIKWDTEANENIGTIGGGQKSILSWEITIELVGHIGKKADSILLKKDIINEQGN